MIGFLRNAAVIGTIAVLSPVHDEKPSRHLDALRAVPGQMMTEALRAGPGLLVDTAAGMDPASREALAAKIAALALSSAQVPKTTNSR